MLIVIKNSWDDKHKFPREEIDMDRGIYIYSALFFCYFF